MAASSASEFTVNLAVPPTLTTVNIALPATTVTATLNFENQNATMPYTCSESSAYHKSLMEPESEAGGKACKPTPHSLVKASSYVPLIDSLGAEALSGNESLATRQVAGPATGSVAIQGSSRLPAMVHTSDPGEEELEISEHYGLSPPRGVKRGPSGELLEGENSRRKALVRRVIKT